MHDAMENEWSELTAQWRAGAPLRFDDLRDRLERQRRRMALWVGVEVVVTIGFVAAAAYMVVRYPGAWSRLWAIDVGVLVAAAWVFSIWNRRGVWHPLGETTSAYVMFARLRGRRKLRALYCGMGMLAAQLLFVAGWLVWGPRDAPFSRTGAVLLTPVAVVGAFTVAFIVSHHRITRELAELDRFAADLHVAVEQT